MIMIKDLFMSVLAIVAVAGYIYYFFLYFSNNKYK